MRYKTFRTLAPVFVLAAVLCLAGMPVSAAPRSEAASPAVEMGWLSGIWQWLGQLWQGGGGTSWQSQASAPLTGTSGAGTGGVDSLKYSDSADRGAALDPNGLR
jgi:hypothetical protein